MSTRDTDSTEIERCQRKQSDIDRLYPGEHPLWLRLMGWADWEIEKQLIERGHQKPVSDKYA